ncbi:MAG TPA: serine/threonine-protein kinase [Solirubrobacterales bacterium]|nr:serine/threonine-protein kinase [Solirubrobacterales bacterium]
MADVRQLGPWRLTGELGRGGNGTVWRAEHVDSGQVAALKEVNTRRADREPYRRFVTEIETLRALGEFPGVLTLLDAHVPAEPEAKDRPWFVMPIAAPLFEALAEADYSSLVGSLAAIAETLAALKAEHGIAHRDVKPANLYDLDGAALIGDFGLVALPDPSGLTRAGKPLGPANFIPFEMLNDAGSADPFPADVYSLAKSFWVLAAGVAYPPPGHQPADAAPYRIADFRPHPQATRLDELVDRATRLNPTQRQSAAELAAELREWLELPVTQADFDLSAASSAVREALAPEIDDTDRVESWKEETYKAARRLEELVRPLNDAMKEADPRAEVGVNDELVGNMLRTLEHLGSAEVLFHFARATKITAGAPPIHEVLRMGRGVELVEEGQLVIRTMIDLGLDGVMQSDMHWTSEERVVPVGSVRQEGALQEAIAELGGKLGEALQILAAKAPDSA